MADEQAAKPQPRPLKEAMQRARIESAERQGVVVDLRDAELARLELLNEALDPLFADVPAEVELFDRGISRGDSPRLWIDVVAHVVMGRDKRLYRFVQDTRYGRRVLAELTEIGVIVEAVTHYVASRMVERERALSGHEASTDRHDVREELANSARSRRWGTVGTFLFGLILGFAAVFLVLWLAASALTR